MIAATGNGGELTTMSMDTSFTACRARPDMACSISRSRSRGPTRISTEAHRLTSSGAPRCSRFQLLDSKREGPLTLQDLEARLPTRPTARRRVKRSKDEADKRVGLPFPEKD